MEHQRNTSGTAAEQRWTGRVSGGAIGGEAAGHACWLGKALFIADQKQEIGYVRRMLTSLACHDCWTPDLNPYITASLGQVGEDAVNVVDCTANRNNPNDWACFDAQGNLVSKGSEWSGATGQQTQPAATQPQQQQASGVNWTQILEYGASAVFIAAIVGFSLATFREQSTKYAPAGASR